MKFKYSRIEREKFCNMVKIYSISEQRISSVFDIRQIDIRSDHNARQLHGLNKKHFWGSLLLPIKNVVQKKNVIHVHDKDDATIFKQYCF